MSLDQKKYYKSGYEEGYRQALQEVCNELLDMENNSDYDAIQYEKLYVLLGQMDRLV